MLLLQGQLQEKVLIIFVNPHQVIIWIFDLACIAVATSLYDPHCERMVPMGISSVDVVPGGNARAMATVAITIHHILVTDSLLCY